MVPGLTTYNVQIPVVCTIPKLKQLLIEHVNEKQQDQQHANPSPRPSPNPNPIPDFNPNPNPNPNPSPTPNPIPSTNQVGEPAAAQWQPPAWDAEAAARGAPTLLGVGLWVG